MFGRGYRGVYGTRVVAQMNRSGSLGRRPELATKTNPYQRQSSDTDDRAVGRRTDPEGVKDARVAGLSAVGIPRVS